MARTDDDVRARLVEGRGALLARLDQLTADHAGVVEASAASNADDEHDPEGATIGFERAQLDAVIASTRRSVAEHDEALARIDAGDYGRCVVCGGPIGAARLEARPTAARCIACA